MVRFLFADDICKVFVNNIVSNINFKNKLEVEKFLKVVIKLLDYRYQFSVSGLFEVDVFVNDNVGIFIEFNKINSIISYKEAELKVNIIYDCDFYFKTKCFECLENLDGIYFNEGYYYINVERLGYLDNYIEFGDVIYQNKLILERDFIKIK